jgi:hypothetical protein
MNAQSLAIPCGRGLAPDSGVPVDIFTGYKVAIGGKPPPTLTSFTSGERHG